MSDQPADRQYLIGKEAHILEVLLRNPDGLYAPEICALTWGHIGRWSIYWRLNGLIALDLVSMWFGAVPAYGNPQAIYTIRPAGVSALGYEMDIPEAKV